MIIISLVNELGLHHWKEISQHLKNRTPRQCRERWTHYLSPNVATSPWTPDDDRILEEKYNEYGGKWTKIKEFLPNKTTVNIKNRYSLLKRKKLKQNAEILQTAITQNPVLIKQPLQTVNISSLLNTNSNIHIVYYIPPPLITTTFQPQQTE